MFNVMVVVYKNYFFLNNYMCVPYLCLTSFLEDEYVVSLEVHIVVYDQYLSLKPECKYIRDNVELLKALSLTSYKKAEIN